MYAVSWVSYTIDHGLAGVGLLLFAVRHVCFDRKPGCILLSRLECVCVCVGGGGGWGPGQRSTSCLFATESVSVFAGFNAPKRVAALEIYHRGASY